MQTPFCLSGLVRRTLALTAILGAGAVVMSAQATQAGTESYSSSTASFEMMAPATASASQSTLTTDAPSNQIALASDHFNFLNALHAMQYGGARRRSGRPRYRGGNENADGSNKYEFFLGGGFTTPTGPTHRTNTPSWGFQAGAGRNFSKKLGVNVEFNWDNFGIQNQTLVNQETVYDPTGAYGLAGSLDGYSHVWSLSLQPVYNIAVNEGLGAYLTVGAGFYHKITTFTVPEQGTYCDPYYGYCYDYVANAPIDSYTSNAPGFNAGLGFTYKFSRFSNERLYGEIRYVYTLNPRRVGVDINNYSAFAPTYDYTTPNEYPANSNRTMYIPVKFGIRF